MTAEATWTPAEELGRTRECQRAGCACEFKPTAPGEVFCSGRCAGLAGLAAREAAIRPLKIGRHPELDPQPETPAADAPPQRICTYGPCTSPVKRPDARQGWQASYCGWPHVQAAKAEREAAAATPDPEPEPAAAPPPSSEEAPVRPDPFTTDDESTAATVNVTPPPDGAAAPALRGANPEPPGPPAPPGPPDDPGHIATRTIQLAGGWLSLTLAVDLFTLDPAERGLVFDLVDAVNRYQHVQGVR